MGGSPRKHIYKRGGKAQERRSSLKRQAAEQRECVKFGEEVDQVDRLSFNDLCPLKDESIVPPLRYSSVDTFARGLGVLQAAGIGLGAAKFDLRGYYRALVCNSREFQYGVQAVDCNVKFEHTRMLLFGQAMNCQIATRVSQFVLAKIEAELLIEQAKWRTDGRLDALPRETREKLAAWESERVELAGKIRCAQVLQWRKDGVSDAEIADRKAKWQAEIKPSLIPWWTTGVFIDDFFGGCFSFFLESMVKVFNAVFARYNIETAVRAVHTMLYVQLFTIYQRACSTV